MSVRHTTHYYQLVVAHLGFFPSTVITVGPKDFINHVIPQVRRTTGHFRFKYDRTYKLIVCISTPPLSCPLGVMRNGPHVGIVRALDPHGIPLERFFEKLCFLDSLGEALQAGEVPVFYCLADSMPVYLKQLLSENSF